MLHFEESYFEAEEREGFYIESMMKKAWAAQLEVLKVIEEICIKHNLRYFAEWGTLLGAVRHQGFIPWDDDIDISMLRDDYEKFLVYAKEELPKGYALLTIYTEPEYDQPFARIVNSKYISYAPERLEKFHGCPYVVGVDLFPLDYIARNQEDEQMRRQLLEIVIMVKGFVARGDGNEEEIETLVSQVEQLTNVRIDRNKPLLQQLVILIDRLNQLFRPEESDQIACLHHLVVFKKGIRQKEWYSEMHWVPFDVTEIPVPDEMHECTRAIYRDKYMIPSIKPRHEYPFYAKQERAYQEAMQLKDNKEENK